MGAREDFLAMATQDALDILDGELSRVYQFQKIEDPENLIEITGLPAEEGDPNMDIINEGFQVLKRSFRVYCSDSVLALIGRNPMRGDKVQETINGVTTVFNINQWYPDRFGGFAMYLTYDQTYNLHGKGMKK